MQKKKVRYYLNQRGEFVIENYNFSKPFASFFPGIAGKYGIPMWVFYVNRAQGIASFGIKDKDHAILEFFPANRAWQLASSQGFRTFLKVRCGKKSTFYEPFHNGFSNLSFRLTNRMIINATNLILEEENHTLGLSVRVEYFNIPNQPFAALARSVAVENLSHKAKTIELLDGLPQIVPFGTSNLFLKKLSRTIEAWMNVENLENNVPFYKLEVDPTDRPEVVHIKAGNFYLGFHYRQGKAKIIHPIVDPQHIFGLNTDFSCPREFLAKENFQVPTKEIVKSKTPCGFLPLKLNLRSQEKESYWAVVGYMPSRETLNAFLPKITAAGYLEKKNQENQSMIASLGQDIHTQSSSRPFNLYAKQTYLDNILRGGYPVVFQTETEKSVFYLYSRKHGDLERDYNKFQLAPTYFSQGNGNYRDINQNRRSDNWFNPDVADENVITFFSLIQTDGFNPLVVKGMIFVLHNAAALKKDLAGSVKKEELEKIIAYLNKPFSPGEVILFLEENKIKLKISYDEFLGILLAHSLKNQEAEHGEGFWIDHWTYNLDLLENYLSLYPEKSREIIFEKRCFTYFDNAETVRPRTEKYLLYNGLPRQLHSVGIDTAKKETIGKRKIHPHLVRAEYGNGEIYHTTLINKLLCFAANKLASLDPCGVGIEMEANKPNWYDALNGLPALFGSSICETFELKRLIQFVRQALEESKIEKIELAEEIRDFFLGLDKIFPQDAFSYWDKSYSLKEEYRQRTRLGLSGKEVDLNAAELLALLGRALEKLDSAIKKAKLDNKEIYCSYFFHEVAEYEPLKPPFIRPTKFIQKKVPLFLEGQVHALKLSETKFQAKNLYQATKQSRLYDKKLKMYKVTASLNDMPQEIGRCRAFTPGWLENESIWLHMEYKYLLEILRQGLFEEFYSEFPHGLVCFRKPEEYGRSILENSSFLVSSAFPDKALQGNGFVARLSGSTAEFLQIWVMMNVGKAPFILDKQGNLNLRFSPVLAGWLFDAKGEYKFNFLSKILVTYHNPKRKNTFGKSGVAVKKILFNDKNGRPQEILSDTIPHPYAEQIRARQIQRIDIYLD